MNSLIHDRCLNEYIQILESNSNIDVGHGIEHVKKIEALTFRSFNEFHLLKFGQDVKFRVWCNKHPEIGTDFPKDVLIRIKVSSSLHEVGDSKLQNVL